MKLGLEGKVVFITGGSKGIGLACARAFAGEGSRVAIASRSQENLEGARLTLKKEGFEVVTAVADFSRAQDTTAAVDQAEKLLGPVDVLLNCAGAATATRSKNTTLMHGIRVWIRNSFRRSMPWMQ